VLQSFGRDSHERSFRRCVVILYQIASITKPGSCYPEDTTTEVRACAPTLPIVSCNQEAEVRDQQSTGINLSYVFRGELRRGAHTRPKT
jgi:hypothetical protein